MLREIIKHKKQKCSLLESHINKPNKKKSSKSEIGKKFTNKTDKLKHFKQSQCFKTGK